MKGKIVEADYVWEDNPTAVLHGYFAINIEECPGFIDNYITYYFEDEDEFDTACSDNSFSKYDFKIVN